jgi:chitinase
MNNLGSLLGEWRQALKQDAAGAGHDKKELLLTATVFYTPNITNGSVSTSYPADALKDNLDWINIRAYDLYDPRSTPSMTEPPAWISVVSAKKVVIGLPFVGFELALKNPDQHDIRAPANGPGHGNDGIIYDRNTINNPNFNRAFNSQYVTHYCYRNYQWIGYDDKDSIKTKIQHAKRNQLGGYFAWHVCADDPNWTLSGAGWHEFYIIYSTSCI